MLLFRWPVRPQQRLTRLKALAFATNSSYCNAPSGQHHIHATQRERDPKTAQQEVTTTQQGPIYPTM
jgi:hypothetical protein